MLLGTALMTHDNPLHLTITGHPPTLNTPSIVYRHDAYREVFFVIRGGGFIIAELGNEA